MTTLNLQDCCRELSTNIKAVKPPIGYLSEAGTEALICGHYLVGQPIQDNKLVPPEHVISADSLLGVLRVCN